RLVVGVVGLAAARRGGVAAALRGQRPAARVVDAVGDQGHARERRGGEAEAPRGLAQAVTGGDGAVVLVVVEAVFEVVVVELAPQAVGGGAGGDGAATGERGDDDPEVKQDRGRLAPLGPG